MSQPKSPWKALWVAMVWRWWSEQESGREQTDESESSREKMIYGVKGFLMMNLSPLGLLPPFSPVMASIPPYFSVPPSTGYNYVYYQKLNGIKHSKDIRKCLLQYWNTPQEGTPSIYFNLPCYDIGAGCLNADTGVMLLWRRYSSSKHVPYNNPSWILSQKTQGSDRPACPLCSRVSWRILGSWWGLVVKHSRQYG